MTHRTVVDLLAAFILVSLPLSVASQDHSEQTAKQPFIVGISAESPALEISPGNYTIKGDSHLFINVRVTNISNRDILIGDDADSRTNVDFFNYYEIRDSAGNSLPKRKLNHPEIGSTGHGWPPRVLKPGTSMGVASDRITGLYDLSRPHEYTIQVSRAIREDPKDGVVKSNVIRVTVTE